MRELAAGPTLVCGWSFGASVALREAVLDERVAGLSLIGFPLSESSLDLPSPPSREQLHRFGRPVLFLSGEGDTFSPTPELRTLAARLPNAQVVVLAGTDHFLRRREKEAADRIGQFAERVFEDAA